MQDKEKTFSKGSLCEIIMRFGQCSFAPGDRVIVLEEAEFVSGYREFEVYNQRLQKKHWIFIERLKVLS